MLSVMETATLASQEALVFEPGTRWLYTNVGMATLGRITEVVSRQPYEQFISERILAPLWPCRVLSISLQPKGRTALRPYIPTIPGS